MKKCESDAKASCGASVKEKKLATFKELSAYWQVADRMIERAGKADMAEVARILALQAAAYARRFGELPIEDHADYMRATEREFDAEELLRTSDGARLVGLLRDGMTALVGVLAIVTERIGDELDRGAGRGTHRPRARYGLDGAAGRTSAGWHRSPATVSLTVCGPDAYITSAPVQMVSCRLNLLARYVERMVGGSQDVR